MSLDQEKIIDRLCAAGPVLCEWFERGKAPLPWREDADPYHVWISEIMLQQTRIEAVKPYYRRFLEAFPDIPSLAEADEEKLLKLWEGLGYYSRARNLRAAAKKCVEEYGGRLPASYSALVRLPGIGSYTGGAISSICFGERQPAVDGNAVRVIFRLCAFTEDASSAEVKADVSRAVSRWMEGTDLDAGTFNQAVMELGERICIPRGQPLCSGCPVRGLCDACREGLAEEIPRRKAARPRRAEERTVFVVTDGKRLLLRKREDRGLLAGMYELPSQSDHLSSEAAEEAAGRLAGLPAVLSPLPESRHVFTHLEWQMKAYLVRVPEGSVPVCTQSPGYIFAGYREINRSYAVPSAFDAYRSLWETPEKSD